MNWAYLAIRHIDDIIDNPNWDVHALQKNLQRNLGHELTISKYYRAKRMCKKIIEGDINE